MGWHLGQLQPITTRLVEVFQAENSCCRTVFPIALTNATSQLLWLHLTFFGATQHSQTIVCSVGFVYPARPLVFLASKKAENEDELRMGAKENPPWCL